MAWKKSVRSIAALLFILSASFTMAQIDGEEEQGMSPLEMESFSGSLEDASLTEEDWKDLTKDLDYGEMQEWEEPEVDANEPVSWDFNWDTEYLQNLIMIIVIGILAGILIYLIAKQFGQRDQKIKKATPEHFEFDDIEEDLPKSDLEIFLEKALTKKDYRTAIRVYYLMIIQGMHEARLIEWEREKTNYQYLNELRTDKRFKAFSELTLAYEVVWYGNSGVDAPLFEKLQPRFQRFINGINPSAQ